MLQENQKILKQELAEAAGYVRSLLPPPITGAVNATSRFVPSTALGGDSFGYHWNDEDNFAFYLLDVCGHGVGAALLSISVMNVLRSQTLPNTDFLDPCSVLSSLNESFQMEKHNNMFFTIWYGVYNKKTRVITYSSGGHPPVIFFEGKSSEPTKPKELQTAGLVIGGMPDIQFEKKTQEVKGEGYLYLYSDGDYEITKPDGKVLTLDEFIQVLSLPTPPGEDPLDRIQEYTQKLNGPGAYADDYSIVKLVFNK
jgi:sigma-B regulation protein RsbU (phosphoserine phosphatase)